MTLAADRPYRLFAFALREGDWPLAGLLAGALGRNPQGRTRLEGELRRLSLPFEPAPTVVGVRTLGRLVRALRLEERD